MSYSLDDTIAAIATAPGGAGRSMVRVSGPAVPEVIARCFVANATEAGDNSSAARAVDGEGLIQLQGQTRRLPCTLFHWPNRHSYTREPVAEFHTLGSPPLAQAALAAVCDAGARLAEPGEFTLRAFLAGRIDLTQAEAVLGVIDAHDAGDLRSAIEQLAGNLAQPLHQMREELLMLLAEVEAGLDFVEEDIEFIAADGLARRLGGISTELKSIEATMASRATVTATGQVALAGAPNAGKSSLFNALVDRYGAGNHLVSAIVSDVSGTTRDYLVAEVELAGQRCQLIDTAGVDDADWQLAEVEAMARGHSAAQHEKSLLRVMCIDAKAGDVESRAAVASRQVELIVLTKWDAVPASDFVQQADVPIVATSSITGFGLAEFAAAVAAQMSSTAAATRAVCVAATAVRCRESVEKAAHAVASAAALATGEAGDELVAAEIRAALSELGKVVGAVYTDDLLDLIFKSFCIGK